ncbi:unnamed protein product [Gongylonema pulchrum]|uniref:Uncharacterized protein n=1 Tax=Gongylonema pulchrum TaxID=637853 RepID=A0A183CUZ1_9BILA|nr:unnamed protein product [Gongylonema pulchrum]
MPRNRSTAGSGVGGSEKGHASMLVSPEVEEMQRRLLPMEKRGGARAFGPSRLRDFETYFFPSNKRHETFSPYYYYQQPKRGGGRAFYSYWSPPNLGDSR